MSKHLLTLGELCQFVRGVSFNGDEAASENNTGLVPILRAGNIQDELRLHDDLIFVPKARVSANQYLHKNDIVICTSSGSSAIVGKTAQLQTAFEGSVGAFCGIIRPRNHQESHYIYYWFQSSLFQQWRDSQTNGSNIQNLRFSELAEIEIPYPPISEQQRHVALLVKADRIRRLRRAALDQSESFLQSVFLEMFGDPATNPKGWPVQPLGELIDPARPITYGIVLPGPHIPDGVPYIRVTDMTDGTIDASGIKRTSKAIAQQYRRSSVKAGDLLISIRGHVGRLAFVPEQLEGANLTQDTARLAVNRLICHPEYLFMYLESASVQDKISSYIKGASVKGVNLGDLEEFPILLPDQLLQHQAVKAFNFHKRIRIQQQEALRQAEHLFQSLLHEAFGEAAAV